MCNVTSSDIQRFNYAVAKAIDNDIEVSVSGDGFLLTRSSDRTTLGKIETVGEMFQYLCGYEAGLDKGLVDGI